MPPNVKGLPTLYPMRAVRAVAFLPIFQYYFVRLFILGPVVICIGTLILQARTCLVSNQRGYAGHEVMDYDVAGLIVTIPSLKLPLHQHNDPFHLL